MISCRHPISVLADGARCDAPPARSGYDRPRARIFENIPFTQTGRARDRTDCKTWLACAFANAACRQGLSAYYVRLPRLFEELRIAHADGSFSRRLMQLARLDLIVIDDWGLAAPSAQERSDLLELLDDRVGSRATLITSQLPIEHWHTYLGDPTFADAILDRVVHAAYKLALTGESMRRKEKA